MRPWSIAADGLTLVVRLTPKGGRDALETPEQLADGRPVLRARVRAAPHDGAANDALRKLVATTLSIAPGRVALVSGASARMKTLKIHGDRAALARVLQEHLGEDS